MADHSTVETDTGPVRGTVAGDHRLFQGIPYAAPPVGAFRWQSPQPAQPWSEPRGATRPGSPCAQIPAIYAQVEGSGEDCLFLNVTTPSPTDRLKPVMVWIHGDGAVGAGSLFDGRRLAVDGDVVVVTINYRLGVFGAFAYPGLAGSGTFGLQDQQAALRWVQRNAAAFGGDPDKVTLFGESYGAQATSAHLTSPDSAGLFQRAILQSSFALMDAVAGAMPGLPALQWFGWTSLAEASAFGSTVASDLGCADPATAVECLRSLPAARLLAHPQIMNLFQRYAFDTDVLPEVPAQALREGRFHQMPVLSGGMRDEHRTFVGLFYLLAGQPITAEQYPKLLAGAFGEHAPTVEARYPLAAYESPGLAWAAVLTDRMWARSTFEQHRALAEHAPTYAYEFADRHAATDLSFPESYPTGAFHGADVPYLFRNDAFDARLTPEQRQLSDHMMQIWANFARSGDPNGGDLPPWPSFDNNEYVQSLAPGGRGIGRVDYATEHQLDFWQTMP